MEDRNRNCPRCSAQNQGTAAFCWKCLALFADGAAPQAPKPGMGSASAAAGPPTPPQAAGETAAGPPPPSVMGIASPLRQRPTMSPPPASAMPPPPGPASIPQAPPETAPAAWQSPGSVAVATEPLPRRYRVVGQQDPTVLGPVSGPPAGPDPNAPGPVPMPASPDTLSPPRLANQLKVGGVVVLLAVAAVVAFAILTAEPKLRIPDSIAGVSRVESPQVREFERIIEGVGREEGVDAEAAIYSNGVNLVFFVIAAEDRSAMSVEEALREFSAGAESSDDRLVVRLSRMRTVTREEVPFACAPLSGPTTGAICSWKDPETVGWVYAPDRQLRHVLNLTVESRRAVRT